MFINIYFSVFLNASVHGNWRACVNILHFTRWRDRSSLLLPSHGLFYHHKMSKVWYFIYSYKNTIRKLFFAQLHALRKVQRRLLWTEWMNESTDVVIATGCVFDVGQSQPPFYCHTLVTWIRKEQTKMNSPRHGVGVSPPGGTASLFLHACCCCCCCSWDAVERNRQAPSRKLLA